MLSVPAGAAAQIAGLPTLQSPFAAPQIAVGVNASRGDEMTLIGLAGAWTPPSGRVQLSGGVARIGREERDPGYAAGARFYLPLKTLAGEAVALGVLVGAGAARADERTVVTAPIGATVGYRRALGATRAFAVYAAPFYSYTGVRTPDASSFLFRFSLGADVVVLTRVGLTVGYEAGQEPTGSEPGLRSPVTGVGLSYAF